MSAAAAHARYLSARVLPGLDGLRALSIVTVSFGSARRAAPSSPPPLGRACSVAARGSTAA